jgi:hypothetical protein
MTAELSSDEQRYLLEVLRSSPSDWFLPRGVACDQFSHRTIDQIVQSLNRRGLMDGQFDCHARLTELGRKTAAQLEIVAKRDWPRFYKRRKVRIALAAVAVLVLLALAMLRIAAVL